MSPVHLSLCPRHALVDTLARCVIRCISPDEYFSLYVSSRHFRASLVRPADPNRCSALQLSLSIHCRVGGGPSASHFDKPRSDFINDVVRALCPGGVLLVEEPNVCET